MPVASAAEIMDSLERLTHAFPGRAQARATMALYVELLADIPGYVLKRAVEEYIAQASWFPKISQLRKAAARVAGTDCFWELPETNIDLLRGESVRLENLFFREGILEDDEWKHLAEQFAAVGRGHGAQRIRQKWQAYGKIAGQNETKPNHGDAN